MRIFSAFLPSVEVTQELNRVYKQVEKSVPPQALRPTLPSSWHVTLEFFGERDAVSIEKIKSIIEYQTKRAPPFACSLGSLTHFGSAHRGAALVCEVAQHGDGAMRLQQSMHEELHLHGLTADYKEWRPHITIGRVAQERLPAETFAHMRALQVKPVQWHIDTIVLMQSTLTRAGSVYAILERFSLC